MDFKSKYQKYKNKYLVLKNQISGSNKTISAPSNNKKDIYAKQKKYYDLFYRKLNSLDSPEQNRYDDLQMNASTGQVIERLVNDVVYLDAQVKKLEIKLNDHYHEVPTTGVRYFEEGQKGPIPDYQPTTSKLEPPLPVIAPPLPVIAPPRPKVEKETNKAEIKKETNQAEIKKEPTEVTFDENGKPNNVKFITGDE